LERKITFYPGVQIQKVKWRKNTLILQPASPLHEDTTYVVVIDPGFTDRHGVKETKGHSFAFATSARIDSGEISGTVYFRREPTGQAVVRCFALPKDSAFAPDIAKEDRQVRTDEKGLYTFSFLPTRETRYVIWAFQDENKNGSFEREKEAAQAFRDTITLSGLIPTSSNRDIYIIDPNEPGEVSGSVMNRTGIDTIPPTVAMYTESDSAAPAYFSLCNLEGAYTLQNVRPGTYALRAFLDITADTLCGYYPCPEDTVEGCLEPCVQYPDTVWVSPGAKVKLDELVLE
jgi:uncharacterized protein (DUF2141 family)